MPRFARAELMQRFQAMAARREPIIGGGAGTGLSARCEQAGGIDLIVIYNSGRYRMAGRGSLAGLLAYGNANEIVVEMGREVLPVAPHTPVLAGVNGTDPFLLRDHFLGQLAAMGFSGIQNFPTVGLIDGTFRQGLEETGMGYGLEIELVRAARQQDLLTTPYVFEPAQAAAMAEAGADILVPHMGLTTGGDIGASTALRLEDCPALIDAMAEAARAVRPDILVLCHGGPIATPEDAAWILQHTQALPRLLRRLVDGAAADRAGADRDHARVQVDPVLNPREATMPKAYASTVLNAPAEEVWALIRDFNALPAWHPAVTDSEIEDGLRPASGRCRAQLPPQGRRAPARAPAQLQRRRSPLQLQLREDPVLGAQLPRHPARDAGHRRPPRLRRMVDHLRLRAREDRRLGPHLRRHRVQERPGRAEGTVRRVRARRPPPT